MENALGGVVQIAFGVRDMARAKTFYGETLGFSLAFEAGGMSFFDAGGVRLLLGAPQPDQEPGAGDAIVYFDAKDYFATESALEARGIQFLRPAAVIQKEPGREHALRFFKDPDGHTLAIMGWRAV